MYRLSPCSLLLAMLAVLSAPSWGFAQGVLVDTRTSVNFRLPRPFPRPVPGVEATQTSYKIESLEVNASLEGSIATVQVSQTFVNTGQRQLEASFVFPLPYDGAIDQLTLMVGNKEFQAELLTKEEARQRYEAIVKSNKDPALLEWIGTGLFQTSVFPIPAGEKRTVTLRYTQLLRKSHGLTDFLFPLSTAKYTAKPLEKLKLRVAINGKTPITNIYSGTHEVKVQRPSDKQAVVTVEQKNVIPDADFRLFFDSASDDIGASLISYKPDAGEPGYFLLLASPKLQIEEARPTPKTVVFVVDRSGSMSGKKIEQARGALKFVLNNLREGDLFNIVAYDSAVSTFKPELVKFTSDTRDAAIGFVNSLFAGGSTNIDAALTQTLAMLKDGDRPSYVIFLTDGLPTAGEQNEAKIAQHAAAANKVRARLFSFGVGYDVNSRLLDKLSAGNHGQSEYVRPNEDIEAAVSKLYRRIGTPVMTDVLLTLEIDGASNETNTNISRIYPGIRFDLFAGDQSVIVGRYHKGGAAKVTLSGSINGEAKSFEFPAELIASSPDDSNNFVAKLWATRRVGEIIDQIDLHGKNQELIDELVALATQYGILTPYTSFLADESSDVRDLSRLQAQADEQLAELDTVAGEYGVNQRAAKNAFKRAKAASGGGGYGGGAFGGGGSYGGEMAPAETEKLSASGGRGTTFYDAKEGRQKLANNVFSLGRKTFFRRADRWVDSTVTEEEEKKAEAIERFSPEYFALAKRLGKRATPYLAIEDAVVVKLDGKTYSW
ncbi:VIT domain-containing protein [Adhaeretor mobilis]|uniref:von Willebrand factor type A domain protein n=1 Tax=Adhaeretor mobilis TaxID=1930276 RepID=A0A517MSI8_9BACT|nr:VIT domain-containing protein [Adhaeretor mobilis]QDS97846.1 von Willebrand factor type A domain protein [Adhaeretor mobilis]